MTIRIASMVRLGLTPKINALGLVFIAVTIVLAVLFELKRRGEKQRRAMAKGAELMLVEQAQTT
jgi:spermidine/putrescine transport system permease protein